jgi:hypothetical protein
MAMIRFRSMSSAALTPRGAGAKCALIAGAIGLAACSGAQNAQPSAESATAPEQPGAGETPSDGETSPPVAAPHGKRAPCTSDQSCNEDAAVSALWGRCTEMGICECNPGFERSPTSDLCRPVPAP